MAQPGQPAGPPQAAAPVTGLDGPLEDAAAAASKANADCIFYLASPLMCKKGDKCEFRHSEAARMNPRECFFWLNQRCLKPNCPFRHPPLKGVGRSMGVQAEGAQEEGPAAAEQAEGGGAPPVYQRPGTPAQGKSTVPCIFFQRGFCAKGSFCPFLHIDSNPPQPNSTTATSAPGPSLGGYAGAAGSAPPKDQPTQPGPGQGFNQQGLKKALSHGTVAGAGAGARAAIAQPRLVQAKPGDGREAAMGNAGAAAAPGEGRQGGPGSGIPGGHPKAQEMALKRARLIEAAALRATRAAGGPQAASQGPEGVQSGGEQVGRVARGGGRGIAEGKRRALEGVGQDGPAAQPPSARHLPGLRGASGSTGELAPAAASAGRGADLSRERGKRLRGAQAGAPDSSQSQHLAGNPGAGVGASRGQGGAAPQPGSGKPGRPGADGPSGAPRAFGWGARAGAAQVNGGHQTTPAAAGGAAAGAAGAAGGVKRRLAGGAAEAQGPEVRAGAAERGAGAAEEGPGFQGPRNLSQIRAEKIRKRRLEMQEKLQQQRLEEQQQQPAQAQQQVPQVQRAGQAQQLAAPTQQAQAQRVQPGLRSQAPPAQQAQVQQAQSTQRGLRAQAGPGAGQPSDGPRKRTRSVPAPGPGGAGSTPGASPAAVAAAGAAGVPGAAPAAQRRRAAQAAGQAGDGSPSAAGRLGPVPAPTRQQGKIQGQGAGAPIQSTLTEAAAGTPAAAPAAGAAPGTETEFRKPRSLQDILMEKRRAREQEQQQQLGQQHQQQEQQPQQQPGAIQAQPGAEKKPTLKRVPVRPGLTGRAPQEAAAPGPQAAASLAAGATDKKPGVVSAVPGNTTALPAQSGTSPGRGTATGSGAPQEQHKVEAEATGASGFGDAQNGAEALAREEEDGVAWQEEGEEEGGERADGAEGVGEEGNDDLEFDEEEYDVDEDDATHEDGGLEAELEGLF